MPTLRLFLFGPLDVRYDNRPVSKPPTTNAQSLLAYLALHPQRLQPRDRLAALFWGDRPDRKARRSLTTALWHIRRSLPDEGLLLSDVHAVQFDPQASLWTDVAQFELLTARSDRSSLQSAVALYRGDFMDGFYHDWVIDERYRLELLYSETLARLMAAWEAWDEHDRALTVALRLLRHDPLREDAHRLAMRAYCRLGHRNAALEQYRRCRDIVEREFDAKPMPKTVALYRDILEGRFEMGSAVEALAPPAEPVEAPLGPGRSPLDPVARGPLVGRDSELAFLRDCCREAQSGQATLVLVHGQAGVGKTRLVEELADQLQWQGLRVLWGRSYAFERVLPFQPVAEALQAAVAAIPPDGLTDVASWILREVARLVPELSETLLPQDARPEMDPKQERRHLFDGVARFVGALASETGLALILEDLHWATESTLQMVHYLVRHLSEHRVLIVGTLRPEAIGPQHPLHAFQRQLSREGLVRSLSLAGLSPPSVETLVREMSGRGEAVAPLARRLYAETEGNPFFLVETIKALFELGLIRLEAGAWRGDFAEASRAELPLPAGVSEAIQARVARLDRDAHRVLQAAAVLGREFDVDLLDSTWHRDEQATLEALDALLRHRFIDEGTGPAGRDYAFQHHKIQEVVYADIPSPRRHRMHARAARAMETLFASAPEAVAAEVAFHCREGCQADWALAPKAIRYYLVAGDQARFAYANEEAVDYYTQALALQKEQGDDDGAARTLMKLGLAHHTHFDFPRARQAFREGFALWRQAAGNHLSRFRAPAPHPLRMRWRSPYTLDPAQCGDYVSASVIDQLFSGLVSAGPNLDVLPEIARSWEVTEAGRRYRFHLRDDARWSDGAPVTAHDFEYAWKRLFTPSVDSPASDMLAVKGAAAFRRGESADAEAIGVEALDDWTLAVELEEPLSQFLYALTHVSACPVPRHVVAEHGASWIDAARIVTNGPFTLRTWDRGQSMAFTRNPLYPGNRRGNVEEVVLTFFSDLSLPLDAYVRGELDVLTLTDASVHQGDRIRRQFRDEYLTAPWLFVIYLAFVTSRSPLDDVRVRQALAMAADRAELADVVLRGMYAPGTGGLVPAGMPGHSPGIGLPYDPSRARQTLAAAGTQLPALEGLTVPPVDPLITGYLQERWAENLGVQVAWDVLDWPPFSQRLRQDPPHLYVLAWFARSPDPFGFLAPEAILKGTRWFSPTHQQLMEEAGRVLDQEGRLERLGQADRVLMQEAPIVPLFYGRQHALIKPWVTNFPISPINRWYWKDAVIQPH